MSFDLSNTIAKVQKSYGKDERRAKQFGVEALSTISNNPEDYVVMPEWFKENYGIMGLRFGHFIEIAGDSDSGKTSLSIECMKHAQQQGHVVIYIETEGKTSKDDLVNAGLDVNSLAFMHTKITEEVYDGASRLLDAIREDYPDAKVLLVLDSFGNTSSMRDSELDLTQKVAQVGGAAKINRMGLGQIANKQVYQDIAVLVVNYNYDNIGSVGKTSAGGKALNFYTMIRIFSSRAGWYERTVQGEKVRAGAFVLWKVQKNHYMKLLKNEDGSPKLLPKQVKMKISADGLQPV